MNKMKLFVLILFNLGLSSIVLSQDWQFSKHFFGDGNLRIQEVEVGRNKNVYIAGLLDGNQDSIISKGSYDTFIAKLNNDLSLSWIKQIGSESFDDFFLDIAIDDDAIYFLTGCQDSVFFAEDDTLQSEGSFDIFLTSYSTDGTLNWNKAIGTGESSQRSTSIDVDENSNLLISGFYTDSIVINSDTTLYGSGTDNFIAKLDNNGNLLWSKALLGSNDQSKVTSISAYSDGYYIDGYFHDNLEFDLRTITSSSSGNSNVFLYKTDYNGNGLWLRRSYGDGNDVTGSITKDNYGNVYYTGYFQSDTMTFDYDNNVIASDTLFNQGDFDIFITKYNKNGNQQWSKAYNSKNREYAVDIVQNYDNLYIGGYYTDSIAFESDTLVSDFIGDKNMFISIFDLEGNQLKADHIKGSDNGGDYIDGIALSDANKAYLGGYFKSSELYVGENTYVNENTSNFDGLVAEYFAPLTATFTTIQNPTSPGGSDGELVVKPYFGSPPYEYFWEPDTLSGDTVRNLSAGDYKVTVTDGTDSTTLTQTLTDPEPIIFSPDINHVTGCYGDSTGAIDIHPTGGTKPYEFFWSTEDGGGLETTAEDQSDLAAGTYTVEITDKYDVEVDTTIVINQPDSMSFAGSTVEHIGNSSPEGAVNLNVSGATSPYSYSWSGPGSFSATTDTITGLTEGGAYTVDVTDDNSCTTDTTFQVIDSTRMNIFFVEDSIEHVSCNGAGDGRAIVTVLHASRPVSYTWTDESNSSVSTTSDSLAYDLSAGKYYVEVADQDTTITDSVVINEPAPLNVDMGSASTSLLDCYGDADGIIDLQVTGGTLPYSYSWTTSDGTGLESSQEDQNDLTAGTYEVTVTDDNGCSATASFTIDEPEQLTAGIYINEKISCYGYSDGELEASESGGTGPNYTYEWNDGAHQTSRIADGLNQGTYQVTVTDENGCTATASRSLSQPDSIQIDNRISYDVTCNGSADGEIHLSASGGTGTKWFSITPQDETNTEGDFTSLAPDVYTVSVTDDNSCPGPEISETITEPDPISISSVDTTNITGCPGDANGSINVNATGGTGSLTYTINPGGNSNNTGEFTGLTAGTYTIEVTDENGCGPVSSGDILIEAPAELNISSSSVQDVSCFSGSDGSITVSAEGGTGTLSYTLQPNGTTNNTGEFTGLALGSYTVEVTDENTCGPVSQDFSIGQPDEILIDEESIEVTDVSEPGAGDGSISLDASGGTAPLTYILNPDSLMMNETGEFNGLSTGKYLVQVTDVNQCGPKSTDSLEIEAKETAINGLNQQYGLKLYPNPAKDNLQLEMLMNNRSDVRLEFVNVIGKTVEERKFTRVNGTLNRTIDVSSVHQGMYFVRFYIDGDYQGNKTIVIEK